MKWYTYKEVAAILQVSVPIVRSWVRMGKLDVVRITHKTVRISQENLDAFLSTKSDHSPRD